MEEVLLEVRGVSLAFGGVRALTEVSFDVRSHEVRAIIGPNGAGKSSLLNVLNGVYHPQQGTIRFGAREFRDMDPHRAAALGIARTFQNIALFKGMTVLDNIMTGRNLKMRCNFLQQALWLGPARREELRHRRAAEEIIDFLEIHAGHRLIQQERRRSSTSSRSSTSAGPRWGGSRTGCRSASSSAGRSPPSRACSCWMSRWPA